VAAPRDTGPGATVAGAAGTGGGDAGAMPGRAGIGVGGGALTGALPPAPFRSVAEPAPSGTVRRTSPVHAGAPAAGRIARSA
jgi:hypothetical protein